MHPYELRDPIHHRIPFDELERRVIDHPFFQRLRHISQLSLLQTYVYPGATHARFSHALGAMHVAGRLFGKVIEGSLEITSRLTSEELDGLRMRLRLAGLLHDLGHGPFSHESESVFPRFTDLPLDWTWWIEKPSRQAKHEDYSVLLIQTLADEGVLDRLVAQDVASLIHAGVRPSAWFETIEAKLPTLQHVLKLLISGEADADRMDYLLRDSYFCGVAYGSFDLDWMISSLGAKERDGKFVLTLAENGVRAFEAFLLARYHMFDQVYFHKTKAGFIHYLEQAIRTSEIPLTIPTDPYAYAELRDGLVVEMLFKAARNPANYWSKHFVHRIPAKRISRFHDDKPEDRQSMSELLALCEQAGLSTFVHRAGKELTSITDDATSTLFVEKCSWKGSELVPVFAYSDLLRKYNESLQFTDVFVRREDTAKFQAFVNKKTA